MSIDKQTNEHLSEVLSHWEVKPLQGIEKIWKTDVYSLELPNGSKAVLKKIGEANEDNIRRHTFCHDVIRFLSDNSIPVANPILDHKGNGLVEHNGHLYVLTPYVKHNKHFGEKNPVEFSTRMLNTGKSMALMHQVLSKFPDEKIDEHVWRAPLSEEMINYRSSQILPFLTADEQVRIEPILNDLVPHMNEAFSELTEQLIHRDCHYANILLDDNKVVAYIDNDHFSIGPRILDVGYFLSLLLKNHPEGILEPEKWLDCVRPFLQGYCSIITLEQLEVDALHYATISIPMQFIGWSFETGQPELGRSMLSAMEWMDEHIEQIRLCMQESIMKKEE